MFGKIIKFPLNDLYDHALAQEPHLAIHEIYNFGITYYTLSLSDICPGIEMKIKIFPFIDQFISSSSGFLPFATVCYLHVVDTVAV